MGLLWRGKWLILFATLVALGAVVAFNQVTVHWLLGRAGGPIIVHYYLLCWLQQISGDELLVIYSSQKSNHPRRRSYVVLAESPKTLFHP